MSKKNCQIKISNKKVKEQRSMKNTKENFQRKMSEKKVKHKFQIKMFKNYQRQM